jgi:DNA-directed RNA polymerase subunit M/transcription elongation factor TFIIS
MTPIEMAKLHQQKRRKIPQRIDHVTAQEQEATSQNNIVKNNKELRLRNANNRYQDVENEVDTSKDDVVPRQQIKSAGKVSNFKQWQQEQEARRKALQLENERAEAEQRNNNVNNNFNKNEKSIRARSDSSGSHRNDNDTQADGQYKDRGTGADVVLNNLKWGSVPRNGRKIDSDNSVQVNADTNNQATDKTLREKKMAILKKQNMKGYDEKAHSPEFNNDNVPQNNAINVENGRNVRKTSGNANTNAFVVDLDSANKQKNVVSNNAANHNSSVSQNRVNNMPEKKSSAKIHRKMSGRPSKTPDANAEQYRESAEMYVRVAEMQLQKDDGSNIRLVECSSCGRKFAADRLPTHERTCMKTTGKQRKTFDSSKMRVKDTEQSKYVAVQSNAPEDKVDTIVDNL